MKISKGLFVIIFLIAIVGVVSLMGMINFNSLSFVGSFDSRPYITTPESIPEANAKALIECETALIERDAGDRYSYRCVCEDKQTKIDSDGDGDKEDYRRCEYRLEKRYDSNDKKVGVFVEYFKEQVSISNRLNYCPENELSFNRMFNTGACEIVNTQVITEYECPSDNRSYFVRLWDSIKGLSYNEVI